MSVKKKARVPLSTVVLLVLVMMLLVAFGGLAAYSFIGGNAAVREMTVEESVETVVTEPVRTVAAADGNPESVLCKDTYSGPVEGAEDVVAAAGSAVLTNRQLQIYYLSAVAAGRNCEIRPEDGIPLAEQICPLAEGLSWQHYYLKQALDLWHTQQALVEGAKEPQIITEEAFQPNPEVHAKCITEDLPVNGFLYQDQPCYTPNTKHQAYLDALPERLNVLAGEKGFADVAGMLGQTYGDAVTAEDILQAAQAYNLAYMYFTEKTYGMDLSDVTAAVPEDGSVNIRHVLLIPEGAEVAADGTVTATEEQWEKCRKAAQAMLDKWNRDFLTKRDLPSSFARLANQNSQDLGSKLDGGLYYDLHKGQLIGALDEWCFDPQRKAGDIAILRSEVGVHIVYLHSFRNAADVQAREERIRQQEQELVAGCRDKLPVSVDYGAVRLWVETTRESVTLEDVLYPDIAHERFPEAITILQQDYPNHRYGDYKIDCGITTMAMLATYMTDTVHSPAQLADQYGMYRNSAGTDGNIFRYVPAELGFYLATPSNKIEEVIEALQNDQVVISLQILGHFTRLGHFLLLQEYYPEDDTFQVRDSNIYNYERLEEHGVDRFTRSQILSGGSTFYIMENKITAIPGCDRCGTAFDAHGPERLLSGAYTCEKCAAALSRRENFQALAAQ